MRYYTRKAASNLALSTPAAEIVVIRNEDMLSRFMARASCNDRIALRVKSFHVNFTATITGLGLLRKCILLLQNIEDLELHLVKLSPSSWIHVLRRVRFKKLQFFSSNCPHDVLAPFLSAASTMRSLQLLVGCGSGQCHLEGRALPLLTDVTAGNACITSVVDNNPVERVVIIDVGICDNLAFPFAIKSLSASTSTITTLHIDFDPDHRDILRQLHEVAPELTALKLVERQRPASGRFVRRRRPWNDAFTWSIDLSRFTQLHRFLLRTPAALVNEADAESKEKELLTVWTTKSARLDYVTLWYLADSTADILRLWRRSFSRGWTVLAHASSPSWDQFL
ncbi:hypothetical protein BKA83DRAFT_4487760 [Pisolithus microcarpus]|nr:hypothetical protein BKA83DRAFT_4504818 [Pisolithus microcarpus]KAI6034767.1 hypothetical protein BKA83DRAFT_4487760 [Pisolithus microcarpus]